MERRMLTTSDISWLWTLNVLPFIEYWNTELYPLCNHYRAVISAETMRKRCLCISVSNCCFQPQHITILLPLWLHQWHDSSVVSANDVTTPQSRSCYSRLGGGWRCTLKSEYDSGLETLYIATSLLHFKLIYLLEVGLLISNQEGGVENIMNYDVRSYKVVVLVKLSCRMCGWATQAVFCLICLNVYEAKIKLYGSNVIWKYNLLYIWQGTKWKWKIHCLNVIHGPDFSTQAHCLTEWSMLSWNAPWCQLKSNTAFTYFLNESDSSTHLATWLYLRKCGLKERCKTNRKNCPCENCL